MSHLKTAALFFSLSLCLMFLTGCKQPSDTSTEAPKKQAGNNFEENNSINESKQSDAGFREINFSNLKISNEVVKKWEDFNNKNEKELLSEALSLANSISPEMAIKDKINLQGKAIKNIEQILDKYGATDIGLALKSTNKFGDFNVVAMQKAYLSDATIYYEKICDITPTNVCLGFTAFKNGSDICSVGGDFESLFKAHRDLLNSYLIFKSLPDSDGGLSLISKKRYIACQKNGFRDRSSDATDFFNFELIKALLKTGENARGLIEQLKTPIYKFYSVIELKKISGEPINNEFINRLKQFVNEKISAEGIDKQFSMFVLGNLALTNKDVILDRNDLREFMRGQRTFARLDGGLGRRFCPVEADLLYEEVIKFGFNLSARITNINISEDQKKDLTRDWSLDDSLMNCNKRLYDNGMLATGRLLAAGQYKEANDFHLKFMTTDLSKNQLALMDLYLDMLLKDKSKINSISNEVAGMWGVVVRVVNNDVQHPDNELQHSNDNNFAVFKKLVDFEKVCDATELMRRKLKNTKYQTEAIRYLSVSPVMTKSKSHKCGNEDLELLLR